MLRASKLRKSEALNVLAAVLATIAIGVGTATAAIQIGPIDDPSPALRPLVIGRSVHVQAAYGPDDEDCVFATYKVTGADGRMKITRRLECAQ